MADEQLSVAVLIDTAPLASGTAEVSAAVDQMAARIKTAFGSVENAPEPVRLALQMLNAELAKTTPNAANVQSMMSALNETFAQTDGQVKKATASMSGLDRAMAMATGRIAAAELGMGMMGSALARVGAASGALGPILAAAFPVFAAVALASVVGSLIEKLVKAQEEARKLALEDINLSIHALDLEHSLELENLKLDDQIEKLEGHPSSNRLAEAVLEIAEKTNQASEKLSELMSKGAALVDAGWWTDVKEFAVKVTFPWALGGADVTAAEKLGAINAKFDEQRAKLAQLTPGTDEYARTLQNMADIAESGIEKATQLKGQFQGQNDVLSQLDNAIITYSSAVKSIGHLQLFGEKKPDIGPLEDAAELARKIKEDNRDDAEYSRRQASEELEEMRRVTAAKKQDHEEEVRRSKEQALAELRDLQLVAAQKTKMHEVALRDSADAYEMANKAAEHEVSNYEKRAEVALAKIKEELSERVISKQQELAAVKEIYRQEGQEAEDVLNKRIEDEAKFQASLLAGGKREDLSPTDDSAYEASRKRQQALMEQLSASTAKYNALIDETTDKELKFSESLKNVVREIAATHQTFQQAFSQDALSTLNSFNSGMGNALASWMRGTETFGYAVRHMFGDILIQQAEFWTEWLLQQAEAWIASEILSAAGAGKQQVSNVTLAVSDAGLAAANVYASVSAIPVVGPFIAPPMAEAALAQVMSYAAIASFAEGGIMPRDDLAILHSQEMVLPADISKGLQGAIQGGSLGGGDHVHFHIHAIDAQSFENTAVMGKIKKELTLHLRRAGYTKK